MKFESIQVNKIFRILGYDDLFIKINEIEFKSLGCGFLSNPIRFCRKGQKIKAGKDLWVEV